MKWRVNKITTWQNDKLARGQVDKMTSWLEDKLTKWQVDKMTSWRNDSAPFVIASELRKVKCFAILKSNWLGATVSIG